MFLNAFRECQCTPRCIICRKSNLTLISIISRCLGWNDVKLLEKEKRELKIQEMLNEPWAFSLFFPFLFSRSYLESSANERREICRHSDSIEKWKFYKVVQSETRLRDQRSSCAIIGCAKYSGRLQHVRILIVPVSSMPNRYCPRVRCVTRYANDVFFRSPIKQRNNYICAWNIGTSIFTRISIKRKNNFTFFKKRIYEIITYILTNQKITKLNLSLYVKHKYNFSLERKLN